MCGRFFLNPEVNRLQMSFGDYIPQAGVPDGLSPRYNIAPTQPVMVIPNNTKTIDFFLWGLIPSWSKDVRMGSKLINARSETVHEKPSFRSAFKRRRCLIPADGFFEWQKIPGEKKKQPHVITMEAQEMFAFAGIWDFWSSPDGDEILSCSILTTEPNERIAELHNRMPVILKPEDYALWLTEDDVQREQVEHLFTPYPAEEFVTYPVSTIVNSPVNDVPQTIVPLQ